MTSEGLNPTATGQATGATATDEYSPYMGQVQWLEGSHEDQVSFELVVRRLPDGYGHLVAAGLADCLEFLARFKFTDEELAFMSAQPAVHGAVGSGPLYHPGYIAYLRSLRFTGEVHALPEGTVIGAQVPIMRVTAPRVQATLIEAALLATVNQATGVATKAARIVAAAAGKPVWDGSLRRLAGVAAGVPTARAGYIGGLAGTATVSAGMRLGIPTTGTMAHAWIQKFGEEFEQAAFETWLRHSPQRAVLLIDTYDVARGAARAIAASRASRVELMGVRIDSGDLAAHARTVRSLLDAAGMTAATIMGSGDLDEFTIAELERAGAPYDKYLVGTALGNPGPLGVVYKLTEQQVADARLHMVMKRSVGKQTDPGAHQVVAVAPGHQLITLADELVTAGRPLMSEVMARGAITRRQPDLEQLRAYVAQQLADLPPAVRKLTAPEPVRVARSAKLWRLRAILGDAEAAATQPPERKDPTPMTATTRTAVVGVDVQTGFQPGGNLAVAGGDEVVEPLRDAIAIHDVVVLSRDLHPADHVSFASQERGGPWPDHCVEGTPDADIDARLLDAAAGKDLILISKGMDRERDAYSAFEGINLGTGKAMADELRERGVTRLLVGGLATDYCVKATVLDALREGFEVVLLTDAMRAVNVDPGDEAAAIAEMLAAGARSDQLTPV
jgi:nicotinate phosphoribosyltransferase